MKKRVLFLCTENSCRSQMAEGFLKYLGSEEFEVESAGVKPTRINPIAVKVMAEAGIDISKHRSKSVMEFIGQQFDYVVTVCDNAKETCPVFSGKYEKIHWSLEDPAAFKGTHEETLSIFRKTRDEIKRRIEDRNFKMMQLKINQLKPKLKAPIILLVLIALIMGGWIYQKRVYRKYDLPANFAKMPVSTQNMNNWKSYHNEKYGFEIKYPHNYYLDPESNFNHISLRQNTTSAEECKKLGMRIGLSVYRLEQGNIHLGGNVIQLDKDLNMDDIARQFLVDDNRSLVRRECYKRDINGNNILICILNAPGEDPLLTGGIYEVYALGIYELKKGDRVLINVNNEDGGTPHTIDRVLRRDLLRILFTLHWSEAE